MLPYTPIRKRSDKSDSCRPPVPLVPGVGTHVSWDPSNASMAHVTTPNAIQSGCGTGENGMVVSSVSQFESSVVNFHVRHGWLYTLSLLSQSMSLARNHYDGKGTKEDANGNSNPKKPAGESSHTQRTYSALFRHIEPSVPMQSFDAVLSEYTVEIQRSIAGLEELYRPTKDGIHPPSFDECRILEAEIDGVTNTSTTGSGNSLPVTHTNASAPGNSDITSLAMIRAVVLLHNRHASRDERTEISEAYSLQEAAELLMDGFTCVALDSNNHHLYYGDRQHNKGQDSSIGGARTGEEKDCISSSKVTSPLHHLLTLMQRSGLFLASRRGGGDSEKQKSDVGLLESILLPLLGPRRWHILSRVFIHHIYASTPLVDAVDNNSGSSSTTAGKNSRIISSLLYGSLPHIHALAALGTIMGLFYTADSSRRLFSDVFIPNWLNEVVDYTIFSSVSLHSIQPSSTALGFIRTALAKTVVGVTAFCALFHTNDTSHSGLPSVMLQLSLSGLFDVGRAASGDTSNLRDTALVSTKDGSDGGRVIQFNSIFQTRRSFAMTMMVAFHQLMLDLVIVHNPIFSLGRQLVIAHVDECPLRNCGKLNANNKHENDQNNEDSQRERKRVRVDENNNISRGTILSEALKTFQYVAISPMEYDMCLTQLFPIVLQQNGFEFPWEAYRRDWRRIFRHFRQHNDNNNDHSLQIGTMQSAPLLTTQMLDDFHRILIKGFVGGASGNRYTYPARLLALMFPGDDNAGNDEDTNGNSNSVVNDAISRGIKSVIEGLDHYSQRARAAQASHHEAVQAYLSWQQSGGVGTVKGSSVSPHMELKLSTTTWYMTPLALEPAVKEAAKILVREGCRAHPVWDLSGKASDVVNEIGALQICLEISVSKLVSEQAQEAHKARLVTIVLLLAVLRLSQLAYRDEVSAYLLPGQPPLVSVVHARRSNRGQTSCGRQKKSSASGTVTSLEESDFISLDSSRFSLGGSVYAAVRSLMINTPQYKTLRVSNGTAIYNAVSSKCTHLCQGGFPLAQYVLPLCPGFSSYSLATIDLSRYIGESCYTPFSQLATTLFHVPLITGEDDHTADKQYPLISGATTHDSLTSPLCLSMEQFIEKMVLRVFLEEHAAHFESYADVVGAGTTAPFLPITSADGTNTQTTGLCGARDSPFVDALYDMSSRGLGMISSPGDLIVCLLIYSERMGLWQQSLENTITAMGSSSDAGVSVIGYSRAEDEESIKHKAREENRWLISVLQKMRGESLINSLTTGTKDDELQSTTSAYFRSVHLNPVVVNSPFKGAFMRSVLWRVTEGLSNGVRATMDQIGTNDYQQLPAALKVDCTSWVALLRAFGLVLNTCSNVSAQDTWASDNKRSGDGAQYCITEALGGFSGDLHRHFGHFIDQFARQ